MADIHPVPEEIVRRVEEYVAHERRDATKFVNRTPLDPLRRARPARRP